MGNVVRIHVANPWPTLITPVLVYIGVFAVNLAIWYGVVQAAGGREHLSADAFANNGGVTWIYVFLLVVAVQAMNLSFAFALGLGVTRRDFLLGTGAYFLALSVFFSAGITACAGVESATDGWGLDGRFFAPWFLADLAAWQQFSIHLMLSMMFFTIGSICGALWVRWRVIGLYVMFAATAVALVGGVLLVSVMHWWEAVGAFFTGHSELVIVAWTLPLTVAAALASFAVVRRATPQG